MSHPPKVYLLAAAILAGCGSDDSPRAEKSHGSDESVIDVVEHALPSEEEVVATAIKFLLAHMETFTTKAEIDRLHENGLYESLRPDAEFFPEFNTWNVMFPFIDGHGTNVELNRDANRGSIHLQNGTAYTTDPDMKGKVHPRPIPLFFLSEFREVVKNDVGGWLLDKDESTE